MKLVSVIVGLLITMEYALAAKMWRNPVGVYRLMLGTMFVLSLCYGAERVFGEGLLVDIPSTVVVTVGVNFVVFEKVMWLRRRREARKRMIYADDDVVEDPVEEFA